MKTARFLASQMDRLHQAGVRVYKVRIVMTSKTVRIGVIGCGFYAQNHLHAWRDLAGGGAVLSAVCDVDPAKAKFAGKTFGVPWYTDVKAMLPAEKLDAVDIVTRQDTHRMLAETTIAYGVATIVQKPFAPTWEDATAIVEAAKKADVWLAVHENFRYQAPLRTVRKVIELGRHRSAELGALGLPNRLRRLQNPALFPGRGKACHRRCRRPRA